MDKYQEAFSKFDPVGTMDEIRDRVASMLIKNEEQNYTVENLKTLHGCLDLTSLNSIDTKESIWKLTERVNDFEGSRPDVPNVASICVYPLFVETVKQALTAQDVKITSVAGGFPSSQTFPEVKVAETALAVMQGADEIDTILNLGYLLEENYLELSEDIQEIKASCQQATLKVILETGALPSPEWMRKAAIFAIYSGADFLKTSTGKEYPGASPESVYIVCQVIRQYHDLTGHKIGVKIAGGVRKAKDAIRYYTIVKEILGETWLNKELFRIGASSLADELLMEIGE